MFLIFGSSFLPRGVTEISEQHLFQRVSDDSKEISTSILKEDPSPMAAIPWIIFNSSSTHLNTGHLLFQHATQTRLS